MKEIKKKEKNHHRRSWKCLQIYHWKTNIAEAWWAIAQKQHNINMCIQYYLFLWLYSFFRLYLSLTFSVSTQTRSAFFNHCCLSVSTLSRSAFIIHCCCVEKAKKTLTDLNWYQHTLDVGFRRRQHCRNVFHLSTPLRYEMIIWFISCWSCFEMYHSNWASSSKVRVFDKQLHNSVIFQLVLYYSTRELHWRFFH